MEDDAASARSKPRHPFAHWPKAAIYPFKIGISITFCPSLKAGRLAHASHVPIVLRISQTPQFVGIWNTWDSVPGPDRLPRVSFRDRVFKTAAIRGEKNFKNISAGKADKAATDLPCLVHPEGPNFAKGSRYSCQAWTISKRLIICSAIGLRTSPPGATPRHNSAELSQRHRGSSSNRWSTIER